MEIYTFKIEGKWIADIEDINGTLLYSTPFCESEQAAIADAEEWIRAKSN